MKGIHTRSYPAFNAFLRVRVAWRTFARRVASLMPKGLYARVLLIIIVPMVLLQSVIAYFFIERHWQNVTQRLSLVLTQDVAALIEIYQSYPQDKNRTTFTRIAQERLKLDAEILPKGPLPPALPKPFFSIVDQSLSKEIGRQIGRPFWVDTLGRSNVIEIRVQLEDATLRVLAPRNAAYVSNSYIFILWMVGTSFVLLGVAIAFMRNQIRPILWLAGAAEDFGKGRELEFYPRGAREVRQAGYAFIAMKRRIERAMDQRTTMLNGVSHDLRTVLTRFKLSLALMGDSPEIAELQKDVEEMRRMLEAYLSFARGDAGEASVSTDIRALIDDLKMDIERHGHETKVSFIGERHVTVRPDAFKRCLTNLMSNAQRHGTKLAIDVVSDQRFLTIHVDDDGPGIPADQREDVFKPFFRLDEARNQDEGGTGLGLAIARDIARSHGGDITLADSPLGGLRASVRIPV